MITATIPAIVKEQNTPVVIRRRKRWIDDSLCWVVTCRHGRALVDTWEDALQEAARIVKACGQTS